MSEEPYLRCTECALELTRDASDGITRCPRCGTEGVPMLVSDDVTVTVNWHELRILGIWAERWAATPADTGGGMQRTVNRICGRLHAQHPEKAPLTLTGEIAELRQRVDGSVEVSGFVEDDEANSAD